MIETTLTTQATLTTENVAQMLAVHPQSVRRLCKNNILPHFRTGPGKRAQLRFHAEDVMAFIERQTSGKPTPQRRRRRRRH